MKSTLALCGFALANCIVTGCGDDMAQDDTNSSGAYGGQGGYGGYGGSGAYGGYGGAGGGYGPGPVGPGGGYEGGQGGGGGEGTTTSGIPDPSPIEPPPEPMECEGLDPSQPLVLYVSSDDSNSMASPVRAREAIQSGVFMDSIRTYEFFNYYRFDYPAPVGASAALFAEAVTGSEPGSIDLQFAVRAADPPAIRRPMTLTFVLDTSGSMSGQGILRERAAVLALSSKLQAGDIVNAVTWSTWQEVLLSNHEATGPNDPALAALAQSLNANGGTDLNAGLVTGYDLAMQTYDPDRLNRVVLISDGGANAGVTEKELIAEHSELNDEEGIYLVGINTGGNGDELMDVVTDEGRGAYVYLDKPSEAHAILANRFDEVMEVAARGVQLQLTVPWYFQMQKFYGEEYSENPLEVKPQHLAPGDTMVLLQTLKACDPSLLVGSDPIQIVATWQTPVLHQPQSITLQTTVDALLAAPAPRMPKGKAIAAYADALKAGAAAELTTARTKILEANVSGTDADLMEMQSLVEQHPSYAP